MSAFAVLRLNDSLRRLPTSTATLRVVGISSPLGRRSSGIVAWTRAGESGSWRRLRTALVVRACSLHGGSQPVQQPQIDRVLLALPRGQQRSVDAGLAVEAAQHALPPL